MALFVSLVVERSHIELLCEAQIKRQWRADEGGDSDGAAPTWQWQAPHSQYFEMGSHASHVLLRSTYLMVRDAASRNGNGSKYHKYEAHNSNVLLFHLRSNATGKHRAHVTAQRVSHLYGMHGTCI